MTRTEQRTDTVWEQALQSQLISHVEGERELLEAYQRAADESHSAAFSYLVSLILDDERRHHAIFGDLARTLQTEVDRRPEAFAVPRLGHWGFDQERILELTDSFLAQETTDAAQLQELEAELEPVKDTTMWPLLIRLMQADTRKHLDILHFIKKQVARGWDASETDWSGIEKFGSRAQ
ncbi:MAG: hypothetical protein M3083_23620 [Actinomycetota bacterium]|nr:hypothetical protein [Actinomycetota bacterium]